MSAMDKKGTKYHISASKGDVSHYEGDPVHCGKNCHLDRKIKDIQNIDMVPVASLDVHLDDVVAIGGPGVGEAEVVMPLLAELRAAGGEDYGALVIVYRRGADMAVAEAFRDKVMAHLSGRMEWFPSGHQRAKQPVNPVSLETISEGGA